ncbi:MAG: hypothetical protein LAT80_05195 [Balneolaceae bacterium]|nr:hypothetical protein [Balneolaceae bacterium]
MIWFTGKLIWTHLKKSVLFYITTFLALFFLYHQTVGVEFVYDGDLKVSGIWMSGEATLTDYSAHIMIHSLIFSILGLTLLVQVTSVLFENHTLSSILVGRPERERVLLHGLTLLAGILFLFLLLHYLILGTYIYNQTGSTILFGGLLGYSINLIPVSIFIASSILFFTVLTESNFSGISITIGYLIIATVGLEIMYNVANFGSSAGELFMENKHYVFPFFIHTLKDSLEISFGLDTAQRVEYHTLLFPSLIFLTSSVWIFNRKVL